ncbi:MAG: class I SAM-dependent methyltransferase [Ignavibacteria bacterium]|jgi:SAM-dependent methyltransferase|nr:class I SAM-dependent methyltransferase [Ignavibacteria bacterium]MCU7504058.1 class I SAM-dependent methyltransferase [Ignavibacteria bacterium]MCU7515430.1 class I SAM-dependent methyltransferase [Ignavibacteria bacterium]
MPEEIKPYRLIAEIYSHLMRFISYEEWAEYYYLLTKDYLTSEASVLELAGGNCRLSLRLKKYYENTITSDLSFEMLKQSEENGLERVCCNMLSLPFKKEFDLIVSAFDSVNYLLTRKSVNQLFREAYQCLRPGGIFSFDVSLERNSIKNIRYLNRKGTYKGIRYIQKSNYDKDRRIHTNIFDITLANGSVFTEIHKQKIFPLEVYFELLSRNGFLIKECFSAFSFEDADMNAERAQFVALKLK